MQIRKSQMVGDRPVCSKDKEHPVHRHSFYMRFGDYDSKTPLSVIILRFICVVCRHTISVIPDDLLPYIALPADLIQSHFDALANQTPQPSVSEKEKGCLKRVWARFSGRIGALLAVLGQMVRSTKPSAAEFWLQLRQQNNLKEILLLLADPFKTSLLADYFCLKPWG